MQAIEGFVRDVLDGRITSSDSVTAVAMTFYGVQGPWYTVGWYMAATIERRAGRVTLLSVMCDPVRFMREYNAVAMRDSLPMWSESLLRRLER